MTKEAEMLALAVKFENNRFAVDGYDIKKAAQFLRAAARPSPDAGLVEREAIARVIDPDLFRRFDKLVIEGQIAMNGEPWAEVCYGDDVSAVHEKTDAILAILSHRGANVVEEAVAQDEQGWPPQFESMKLQALAGDVWIDVFPAQLNAMRSLELRALVAAPAPAGRDPATIEAAIGIAIQYDGPIAAKIVKHIRALAAPAVVTEEGRTESF